jgi:hypothetical protein
MNEQTIREEFENDGGFPTLIADILTLSADVEPEMVDPGCDEPTIDCRLNYQPGRGFAFLTGNSQYDQDHRGFWGSSCVGANEDEESARDIASDLFDQVVEHVAQSEEWEQ